MDYNKNPNNLYFFYTFGIFSLIFYTFIVYLKIQIEHSIMPKVKKEHLEWTEGKLCEDGRPFPDRYYFYCPGCYEIYKSVYADKDHDLWYHFSMHVLNVRDVHGFNGDIDNPTFTPSLLVESLLNNRCHSYVTDGKIQYLPDSTHPLSGQTIDLPEID